MTLELIMCFVALFITCYPHMLRLLYLSCIAYNYMLDLEYLNTTAVYLISRFAGLKATKRNLML